MQEREILVANTKTQKRYKVTTDAATLGELKEAFTANGIDFEGLSFTEGITKTLLLDDASPIPETVTFKGEQKNPVILLTNTKKNIASGAEGSRKEAYEIIKEYDYAEAIKEKYGINYTHISTADLWEFINAQEEEEDGDYDPNFEDEEGEETPEWIPSSQDIVNNIYDLVKMLAKQKVISPTDVYTLTDLLTDLSAALREIEGNWVETTKDTVTNADLDKMIADLI